MGTYYDLKLDITLKPIETIGQEVHRLLTRLFDWESDDNLENEPEDKLPDHPFWRGGRFYQISLTETSLGSDTEEKGSYQHPVLKLRCCVSRDYAKIPKFLDWITPYVESIPEKGEYHGEHDYDNCIERTEVSFETDPKNTMRFVFIQHKDNGGDWRGTETTEEKEWIKDYHSKDKK